MSSSLNSKRYRVYVPVIIGMEALVAIGLYCTIRDINRAETKCINTTHRPFRPCTSTPAASARLAPR